MLRRYRIDIILK